MENTESLHAQTDGGFERQRLIVAAPVDLLQRSIFQYQRRCDADKVGMKVRYFLDGLVEGIGGLTRQAAHQMKTQVETEAANAEASGAGFIRRMSPGAFPQDGIIERFDAQFDSPDTGGLEKGQRCFGNAVGTGGDTHAPHSHPAGIGCDELKAFPHIFRGERTEGAAEESDFPVAEWIGGERFQPSAPTFRCFLWADDQWLVAINALMRAAFMGEVQGKNFHALSAETAFSI